jgi:hypothetical protein
VGPAVRSGTGLGAGTEIGGRIKGDYRVLEIKEVE